MNLITGDTVTMLLIKSNDIKKAIIICNVFGLTTKQKTPNSVGKVRALRCNDINRVMRFGHV